MKIHLKSMHGLGDNIYQRAIISRLDAEVWLATPWPELYADLPHVHFIKPESHLWMQALNIRRYPDETWGPLPPDIKHRATFEYASALLRGDSILKGMEKSIGVDLGGSLEMTLPDFRICSTWNISKPLGLIRPVTIREEWQNEARNPLPEYIAECAWILRERGYHVISIASLAPEKEWLAGADFPADQKFHSGELSSEEICELAKMASIIVGGVGFIVPLAMTAKTPAFIVHGGCGLYNNPYVIEDERVKGTQITHALPDNYCFCNIHRHNCDKGISDFSEKFERFLDGLTVYGISGKNADMVPRKGAGVLSGAGLSL